MVHAMKNDAAVFSARNLEDRFLHDIADVPASEVAVHDGFRSSSSLEQVLDDSVLSSTGAQTLLFGDHAPAANLREAAYSQATLARAKNAYEAASDKLAGKLAGSPDIMRVLGSVMYEINAIQRENHATQRLASRSQAKSELLSQAGHVREAADSQKSATITSCALQIAFSAGSCVLGGAQVYGGAAGLRSGSSVKVPGPDTKVAAPKPTADAAQPSPNVVKPTPDVEGSAAVPSKKAEITTEDKQGSKPVDAPGDAPVEPANVQQKNANAGKKELTEEQKREMRGYYYGGLYGLTGTTNTIGQTTGQLASMNDVHKAKYQEADGTVMAAASEETKSEGDYHRDLMQVIMDALKNLVEFREKIGAFQLGKLAALTKG